METWMIFAIAVVVAAIVYFMLRKKIITPPPTVVPVAIPSAPGVMPSTGTVPPSPSLPAPQGSVVPKSSPGRSAINHFTSSAIGGLALGIPNPALVANIPIVGGALAQAEKIPTKVVTGTLNASANVLQHVPIVGGLAAAPVKVASKTVSAISNFFGF